MLKLPLIELFLRILPEGFLFILAAHLFTKTKLNRNKYILSSLLLAGIGYLIRYLPIDNGVHAILTLILIVLLATNINKINVIKSIQAGIVTMITMFVSEGINVSIIQFVLKKDINDIFNNSMLKIFYGLPSLLIFVGILCLCKFVICKRDGVKHVSDRTII